MLAAACVLRHIEQGAKTRSMSSSENIHVISGIEDAAVSGVGWRSKLVGRKKSDCSRDRKALVEEDAHWCSLSSDTSEITSQC